MQIEANTDRDGPILVSISGAIAAYTARDGRSIRQIEHLSGISRGYITRLATREIFEDKIDPLKLFQVLRVVKGSDIALKFLSVKEEWISKVNHLLGFSTETLELVNQDIDVEAEVLKDSQSIVVFTLACNMKRTSVREITDICGKKGVKSLNRLADLGILTIAGDIVCPTSRVVNADGTIFAFSKEGLAKIIPVWLEYYDSSHSGQNRNYLFGGTQKVAPKFLNELQSKIAELHAWYNEEVNKEENIGENPIFFTMALDSFTDDLVHDKEVLQ